MFPSIVQTPFYSIQFDTIKIVIPDLSAVNISISNSIIHLVPDQFEIDVSKKQIKLNAIQLDSNSYFIGNVNSRVTLPFTCTLDTIRLGVEFLNHIRLNKI